nr:hypothetical protein [Tanacetum cinerariifolium]
MDTSKNIVDLEAFREMLHISPRVPGQSFDELPFEEEILDFLRFLGHSAQIKTLTDKPSIPRRNKVNWHYVRDDILKTTSSEVERTEAEQLKIVLRRSRQETHISQYGGSSTDEETGSKPGVPDVPSDDSEEEILWNSFEDEDVDDQDKSIDDSESEKNDESDADDDDQDEAEKDDDDD